MPEENKPTADEKASAAAPSKTEMQKIQEDYQKATPKERAKKFRVDPTTKTLRRA